MKRFAVSLVFKEFLGSNKSATKIRSAIVKAHSTDEAVGKFYQEKIKDNDLKNASLLLHTVLQIDNEPSKNETT